MEMPLLCELLSRLRREFDRYQFHVDAEIEWRGQKLWGHVKDIGRWGMFIELANPPSVGAVFVASLALNVPFRLECVVRHIVPGRGVGVAISVGEGDQRRFEALLLALSSGADTISASVTPPEPEQPQAMVTAQASHS